MRINQSIGRKLLACFGALLAIVALFGVAYVYSVRALSIELDRTVNATAKKQMLAGRINASSANLVALENRIIIRSMLQDQASVERFKRDYADSAGVIRQALKDYQPLADSGQQRHALENMSAQLDRAMQAHEQMLRLFGAQQGDAAIKLFDETVLPQALAISGQGDTLARQEAERLAAADAEARRVTARSWALAGVLVVLAGGAGVVVLFVVRRMNRDLRRLATELADGSQQVDRAATQVSGASQSLAQGASRQAASLEETSASTAEMAAMTRKNAEDSNSAASLVAQASQKVADANRNLDQLVQSMKEIKGSSEKISHILKVIEDIAFQTNILALNAAVEAARAGEAGLGFAVVAEEVRNLAQRCAQAAKDTAELIDESISKTNDGGARLNNVAQSIVGITESTNSVKMLVEAVNSSSQEQATGFEQIARAVAEMEQVTQRSAASAEQSASASEELNSQAAHLMQLVGDLRAMVGGADG